MEQIRQLEEENQSLRTRLSECQNNEEMSQKKLFDHDREINEVNEKYEQKWFSIRMEYETKIEQLTNKTSEQQMEIFTLKQINQTVSEEKSFIDQQIYDVRMNEQNLQEKLDQLQMQYNQLLKANKKPLMLGVFTQTVSRASRRTIDNTLHFLQEISQETIEDLKQRNLRLNEQLTQFQTREEVYSRTKRQYEQKIEELSKRPTTTSINLQTGSSPNLSVSISLLLFILGSHR